VRKFLEFITLIILVIAAALVGDVICFKHEGELREKKTCRWITRCVPKAFGGMVFTNIRNSYMCPEVGRTTLVEISTRFFH
jgi:hypothetical protein